MVERHKVLKAKDIVLQKIEQKICFKIARINVSFEEKLLEKLHNSYLYQFNVKVKMYIKKMGNRKTWNGVYSSLEFV